MQPIDGVTRIIFDWLVPNDEHTRESKDDVVHNAQSKQNIHQKNTKRIPVADDKWYCWWWCRWCSWIGDVWGVFGVARCYARTSTMSREYYRYVDVCGVYAMAGSRKMLSLLHTCIFRIYTILHCTCLCYIYIIARILYTGRRIHQHVYTELTQMFYPLAYYKITGYVLTKPPVRS